jgi:hypothetical protein
MTDDMFQNRLLSLPPPACLVDFELAIFDLIKTGTRAQRNVLLEMLRNVPQSERPTAEKRISRALSVVLGRIAVGEAFIEAPELRVALTGPAVTIWRAHHGYLNGHAPQPSDAICPVSFDWSAPLEIEAKLGEELNGGINVFHHEADVVHTLDAHGLICFSLGID